jgi:hypothetical protein
MNTGNDRLFQGQGVMNNKGEPPSRRLSRAFPMLIGKNSRGHWVVRSQDGLSGGLFVNRTEAVRYALFESGRRPDAVVMVPGCLELALNEPANAPATAALAREAPLARTERTRRSLFPRHTSPLPAMG